MSLASLIDLVVGATDGDDDYAGTVYPNNDANCGKIVSAVASLGEPMGDFASPDHPKATRAMVEVELIRVRIGNGNTCLNELHSAFIDKLKNKAEIKGKFEDRVNATSNPNNPPKDKSTNTYPFLLVESVLDSPVIEYGGQREEHPKMRVWIYHQRFPRQNSSNLIGD